MAGLTQEDMKLGGRRRPAIEMPKKNKKSLGEELMTSPAFTAQFNRRTILKAAGLVAASQVAAPFVITARGENPVRMGMVDPLTGGYAAPAGHEVRGAKLAVEQLNAKGGILGRQVELLVEDSANDVGTGVQKARKLIERDQVNFMIGDVNSGIAAAIAQVTSEKRILHIVSGGHTDSITGKDCKWNVFRVCNTTRMEANSVSSVLYSKYGKKWHFITPDYAFGHTLYGACTDNLKRLGVPLRANEPTPLGTTYFSAYLIKARAANPDVMILLVQGSDMINCLKQVVQFGLNKQIHVAGTQQELESLAALPPEARIGVWMFEWYWKQPGVPGVEKFVADIRKVNNGNVPTARHWFGYTSAMSFALVANREKTTDAVKLAAALENFELPDDVKLQPNKVYYRKGDHQLMTSAFVGEAQSKGKDDPEDLYRVDEVVPGDKTAPAVTETGCIVVWPS